MIVGLRRTLLDGLDKHVERYIDIHRSRPAIGHQRESLTESKRQHVRPRRLKAALDVRTNDVNKIPLEVFPSLLKRTAIPLPRGHVTSDVEHRRGIGEGSCDREDKIRRARAARSKRGHGLLRDAKVCLSHEAGRSLVVHGYGFDLLLAVEQSIEQSENAVTTYSEHIRHLLLDQEVRNVSRSLRCWLHANRLYFAIRHMSSSQIISRY